MNYMVSPWLTIIAVVLLFAAWIETRFFTKRTYIGSFKYETFCFTLELGLVFTAFSVVGWCSGW